MSNAHSETTYTVSNEATEEVVSISTSDSTPYKFVEEDGENDPSKYPHFFQLVRDPLGRDSTPEEEYFVRSINDALRGAKVFTRGSDLENQMADLRDEFAMDARAIANEFVKGEKPLQSIDEFASRHGEFKRSIRELAEANSPNRAVNIKRGSAGFIEDLQFDLRNIALTEEQEQLFVEIQKVVTVIKVVFEARLQTRPNASASFSYKRDDYLKKISEIAMAGLTSPDKVRFAKLALQGFKNEFVSLEAESVKNQYVRLLGRHVLGGMIFFIFLFIVISALPLWVPDISVGPQYKLFLLMAAGACVGTWLSFAIRRVILEFEDLALLEDDRLDPTSRLFFVVLLTLVVGLLIVTKMVGIKIGDVALDLSGEPMAILIGLLCGISERGLAGGVANRAEEFAGRIGGTVKPVA